MKSSICTMAGGAACLRHRTMPANTAWVAGRLAVKPDAARACRWTSDGAAESTVRRRLVELNTGAPLHKRARAHPRTIGMVGGFAAWEAAPFTATTPKPDLCHAARETSAQSFTLAAIHCTGPYPSWRARGRCRAVVVAGMTETFSPGLANCEGTTAEAPGTAALRTEPFNAAPPEAPGRIIGLPSRQRDSRAALTWDCDRWGSNAAAERLRMTRAGAKHVEDKASPTRQSGKPRLGPAGASVVHGNTPSIRLTIAQQWNSLGQTASACRKRAIARHDQNWARTPPATG